MRKRRLGSLFVAAAMVAMGAVTTPAHAEQFPDAYTQIVNHQIPVGHDGAPSYYWFGWGKHYTGPNGMEIRLSSNGTSAAISTILTIDSATLGTAITGSVTTIGGAVLAGVSPAVLRDTLTYAGLVAGPLASSAATSAALRNECLGITIPNGSLGQVLDRALALQTARFVDAFKSPYYNDVHVWFEPCSPSSVAGEGDILIPLYMPGVTNVLAAQPILSPPPSPAPLSRIVTLDAANAAWANNDLGPGGWTRQTNPGTTLAIAAGGNRIAILNTAHEIWAKDGLASSGWTQMTPTGNSIAVAVGSSGRIMATDACGAAWANDHIAMSGWTQITGCGDSRAIAVGGTRMMIINGCGAAYAKDAMTGPMNQISPCGNTKAIAAGSSGRMFLIDACYSAWASDTITSGWTQEAPCGNAKSVAVGGSRLALLNNAGEVWAKDNITPGGWTQITPTGNTTAIAAGSSGRIVEIDACGSTWARDTIGMDRWAAETPCGNSLKIAVG